jgi:hypothetical protein
MYESYPLISTPTTSLKYLVLTNHIGHTTKLNVGHVESLKSEALEGTGSVYQVSFKLGQTDSDVYVIWRMILRRSKYFHLENQVVFCSLKVERLLSDAENTVSFVDTFLFPKFIPQECSESVFLYR